MMHMSPKKRVLKRVLLYSLQRYRNYGHLPHRDFEEENADYPQFLRDAAATYEQAPPELTVEEPPVFTAYDRWAESYDSESENPVILGEIEALGNLPRRFPAHRVLDVGAGTGRHAVPYARADAKVTALEPSEGMLTVARKKAENESLDIDFRHSDLTILPEISEVYDLVLCCLVLSHVPDLETVLEALCERVADGGRLIITDFHPFNLLTGMRTSFSHREQKYYVSNTIHLASDYIRIAKSKEMTLQEFHETGTITGYPQIPATLSLVFHRCAG